MRLLIRFLLLLGLLCFASSVSAHDPGISSSRVSLAGDRIFIEQSFSDAGAGLRLSPSSGRTRLETSTETRSATDDDHTTLRTSHPRPRAGELVLEVTGFESMPFGHRHYVSVWDASGDRVAAAVLSAESPEFAVALDASTSESASAFFSLGVEHVLAGADHLLFLLALLLVCDALGSVLRIVTTFTLAHSLTLALAALGLVHLPSAFVEGTIAASIVVVAALNCLGRDQVRERVALTLGFGLIHGLGFAGALSEIGIGTLGDGALVRLLFFNLGVEIGQLAFAMLVVPLLWAMRRSATLEVLTLRLGSAAVAVVGAYWFLERSF